MATNGMWRLPADAVVHACDVTVAELHAAVDSHPALEAVTHVVAILSPALAFTMVTALNPEAVVN